MILRRILGWRRKGYRISLLSEIVSDNILQTITNSNESGGLKFQLMYINT